MKLAITALILSIVISGGLLYKNRPPALQSASPVEIATYIHDAVIPYTSPISIEYMRSQKYESDKPVLEQKLADGSNYERYLASYMSSGNKIYGLLTIPKMDMPEGGFKAIVFNHGYIPPSIYVTTERYVAYVDYLAKQGFVVFKIDMRGHGESEGISRGSYFASGYTIDALNAVSSLQKLDKVNPNRIGMWGHSMAGNLTLRAMEVSDKVKAGVIWGGAVYSYYDFGKYGLSDTSYRPPVVEERSPTPTETKADDNTRENSEEVRKMRENYEEVDFSTPFWKSISLTQNLKYLNGRKVQLHHAVNDSTVNVGYMRDLKTSFEEQGTPIEAYEYSGGNHDIESPYFDQAIQRTAEFFDKNL